jgi:hypothetical protein
MVKELPMYEDVKPFMTSNDANKPKNKYPTGAIHAVCSGVYDIGVQKNPFDNKLKHQGVLLFEFINEDMESDNGSNRMTIGKTYSSLNLSTEPKYKSKLQKDLESWRNVPFTEDEIKNGFDLNQLYGVNCTIVITLNEKGYANISTITRKGKNDGTLIPERKFGDKPDWVQKLIDQQVDENEAYESEGRKEFKQRSDDGNEEEKSFNDDIPF